MEGWQTTMTVTLVMVLAVLAGKCINAVTALPVCRNLARPAVSCCIPLSSWTRDHEMVITSSRLANGTHLRNISPAYLRSSILSSWHHAECTNENHTL